MAGGGVSGGAGKAGVSRAASVHPSPGGRVTTPSGPHTVATHGVNAGKQSVFTPLRGTVERTGLKGVAAGQATRAGAPFISPVATAQFRQQRPLPPRTFGMNPVVRVRQMPPVR